MTEVAKLEQKLKDHTALCVKRVAEVTRERNAAWTRESKMREAVHTCLEVFNTEFDKQKLAVREKLAVSLLHPNDDSDFAKAVAEAMADEAQNPWKRVLMDALVVSHIYRKEHEDNPVVALNDLISWEQVVALDPAVSEDAAALIERGRQEGRA